MVIFTYTPSPAAVRGTINGTNVAWDIFDSGTQIRLMLLEQVDATEWGIIDDSNQTNPGLLWSLFDANTPGAQTQVYIHPNVPGYIQGYFYDFVNKYGAAMIDDYLPKVNSVLAARFPATGTAPATPPATVGNFTNDADARQFLAGALLKYKVVGNQIALK